MIDSLKRFCINLYDIELIKRLAFIVIVVLLVAIVLYISKDWFIQYLSSYYPVKIFANNNYNYYLASSFHGSLFATFPLILYILWGYLFSDQQVQDRRKQLIFVSVTTIFFVTGGMFTFYYMIPHLIGVSNSHSSNMVTSALTIIDLSTTVLQFAVLSAIPLFLYFMGKNGVIKYNEVARWHRFIIIGIFVFAMISTPPDVFTMILFALPLFVYIELFLVYLYFLKKKSEKGIMESMDKKTLFKQKIRSRNFLIIFALLAVYMLCLSDGFGDLGSSEFIILLFTPFFAEMVIVLWIAFQHSLLDGFLCLLLPFYGPYFVYKNFASLFERKVITMIWAIFSIGVHLYSIYLVIRPLTQ